MNRKIDYDYFFSPVGKTRGSNYLRRLANEAHQARGKVFKFSTGNPNSQCFPYEEVSVKLKNGDTFKLEGQCLAGALSYSCCQPLLDLLKNFQDRLHGSQDWKKKNLTCTTGIQAGLYQLMETCVSPADPVLVQSPLYPGVISILKPFNVEFLELDSGADGICAKTLRNMLYDRKKRNLKIPKIFYVCPTGNNPTGDIIPTQNKKDIYTIACEYNFLIVEDDPYYLLSYNPREKPISFMSMDTENRVVRFDSVSKTIGAGYRLGYITAAQEIIDKINIVMESSNYCPPFCQVLVYETLHRMGFDGFMSHVAFIRDFYFKNRTTIMASLDKYLKDVATWVAPQAAMFVWLTIKNIDQIPESFVRKCIENSVFIAPGFAFYANERQSPCIRLAFSMLKEDEIDEGVKVFAKLLKEELLNRNENAIHY